MAAVVEATSSGLTTGTDPDFTVSEPDFTEEGNLLVMICGWQGSSVAVDEMAGNSDWVKRASVNNGSGLYQDIFTCDRGASAPNLQFDFAGGGNSARNWIVYRVSGADAAGTFTVSAQNSPTSSTVNNCPSMACGADDLCILNSLHPVQNRTFTQASGYTEDALQSGNGCTVVGSSKGSLTASTEDPGDETWSSAAVTAVIGIIIPAASTGVTGTASGSIGTITGTAATTLRGVDGTASGSIGTVTGSAATTLRGVTGTASGSIDTSGSAATTLVGRTGTASGDIGTVTGDAATTLRGVLATGSGDIGTITGSATGTSGATGTASGNIGAIVGSATGTSGATGTASGNIGAIVGSASGTLRGVTGTASGTVAVTGDAATTLRGVLATASGDIGTITGSATGTSGGPTGTASGDIGAIVGSASGTLRGVSGTGVGLVVVTGAAATTLRGVLATGSGSIGTVTGSVVVTQATYLYTPPTATGPRALLPRSLAQRRRQGPRKLNPAVDQGVAVLLNGATYSTSRLPRASDIEAADAVYLGGHEYTVSEAVKTAIEASGVGGTFVAI